MENTGTNINSQSRSSFFGKTFGYMFLALVITAGIAFGLSWLFTSGPLAFCTIDHIAGTITFIEGKDTFATIYFVLEIASFIGIIATSIWFSFSSAFGKRSLWAPFIANAVVFGVFFSALLFAVDSFTLLTALGLSALFFASMALFGVMIKNIGPVVLIMMGLATTLLFGFLFGFILSLLVPGFALVNYLIVSGACLLLSLLCTIFDVWNVKKISEAGEASNNVALYFAFHLYLDFLIIFVRILRLVSYFRN